MSKPRGSRHDAARLGARGDNRSDHESALEENVEAIRRWERAILLARSRAEQVSDWIAATAGSGPVLVFHVVWFGVWVTVNDGAIRGIRPFDPFPYPFLTMAVSLEAIFLALFVLASQNRLSRQADKRSHLDLQVDLLAEREMTAVLQLLQDIARHFDISTTITHEQLADLMKKTDLRRLTNRMDELAEPANATAASTSSPVRNLHPRQHQDAEGSGEDDKRSRASRKKQA